MARADAPTGTVTFLFTDIEGSTRLWDHHPDAMTGAMSTHDVLLQQAIDDNSGYVFSKAGDGWGVAFSAPESALSSALTIQNRIAGQHWPDGISAIKIRMGLHTGTSAERGGDYFGTTVNRAARVAGVAEGGQVFLTDAVHALVADELRGDWRFRDLGEHRLRDLTRAERIWQVDQQGSEVPLATLAPRSGAGNIPRQRASIFGRDAQIQAVAESVRHAPLITLVGVGGVGKTTIAKAVGLQVADRFPAGAWFVDLTATDDPDQIASTVAASLDVTLRPDMTARESLFDALSMEHRLVILDNAEHQVDAVADLVDAALSIVPDVRILVTSREPLRLGGEIVHSVDPLGVSAGTGTAPAIELFVQRATAVARDLTADSFDLTIVEAICGRLDGLPLAIELAASQCETMTPSEILAALESDSLDLHSASRSTVDRHRSLDDMISWSYDLLGPTERTVFDRLSAFKGGCTMDAALFVCSDDTITDTEVRASVATLVRKSMVGTSRDMGATRLSMLDALRHFSSDRLAEGGERDTVAERHARWFGRVCVAAQEGMVGPEEARYLSAMLGDMDNLQAAALWTCGHGYFDLAGDLVKPLPYLVTSNPPPGMVEWVEDVLSMLPRDHVARLDCAVTLAEAAFRRESVASATQTFLAATADVSDRKLTGVAARYLERASAFFSGDLARTIDGAEAAIAELHEINRLREAGSLATNVAMALFFSGDLEEARRFMRDAMEFAEHLANPTLLAWAMYGQGEIEGESDPEGAIAVLEESVELGLSIGNEFVAGISLVALSSIAGRRGDMDTAFDGMHRCILIWRAAGNHAQLWTAVRNLVEMLHRVGRNADALTLNAVVEADAENASELFGPYGDRYRSILTEIEASVPPDRAKEAIRFGSSLDYRAATAFALDAIERAK